MLLYDFSLCTYAKASLLSCSRWQQTLQERLWSPTICQLCIPIGPQAALEPQVADPGSITRCCMGTRASVTAKLQGPILYMVSAPGLNKGSQTYVMDLGPSRQNESFALHNSNWFTGWSTNSQTEENSTCARKFYTQEYTAQRNASSGTCLWPYGQHSDLSIQTGTPGPFTGMPIQPWHNSTHLSLLEKATRLWESHSCESI